MRAQDDLYKLIKSLSRSEKRYFTLDAQKSGARSSNYLKLFQAYNEMKEWDESDLRMHFDHFSSDKAYLYDAILKSMRDYRSPKSTAARIKERILDARFLYERGLYDQSEQRLASAAEMARKMSDALALLEINREERRLKKETELPRFRELLVDLVVTKDEQLQALQDEFFFQDIYDRLSLEIVQNFQVHKEDEKRQLFQEFQPDTWVHPLSPQAYHRFLQVKAFFYHLIAENEKAGQYFFEAVNWWDTHPEFKREEFFRYIIDLSNWLAINFATGQMRNVGLLLQKLEKESPETIQEEELVFQKIMTFRLAFALENRQFEQVSNLDKELEAGLKKYYLKESTRLTILIQMALLMFHAGRLMESRSWVQQILQFKDRSVRRDIHKAARILDLIIVGATEEVDTVEGQIRSCLRFFKKHFKPGEVQLERNFINVFKGVIPLPLTRTNKSRMIDFLEKNPSRDKLDVASLQIMKAWIESL